MTNEEILQLARECGINYQPLGVFWCREVGLPDDTIGTIEVQFEDFSVFAHAIKNAALEEAAGICDALAVEWKPDAELEYTQDDLCAEQCAAAIREAKTK